MSLRIHKEWDTQHLIMTFNNYYICFTKIHINWYSRSLCDSTELIINHAISLDCQISLIIDLDRYLCELIKTSKKKDYVDFDYWFYC